MPNLPEFPRPDLPSSAPENIETLRIRALRRLGLPDDGRLWINDAIDPETLASYDGSITSESPVWLVIRFSSLDSAVSWAESVTTMGHDREMIEFVTAPTSLYGETSLRVQIGR